MADKSLIDAVKSGDTVRVSECLKSEDVHQKDEHGWTPLSWAAGTGKVEVIKLLVDAGADVGHTGEDARTPYMIALAAGRVAAVEYLMEVEARNGATPDRSAQAMPYCKAYPIAGMAAFEGWHQSATTTAPPKDSDIDGESQACDDVVFLHHDYTVTKSIWHNEDTVFDAVTPEWKSFCEKTLRFKVPTDLDLIRDVSQATATGHNA